MRSCNQINDEIFSIANTLRGRIFETTILTYFPPLVIARVCVYIAAIQAKQPFTYGEICEGVNKRNVQLGVELVKQHLHLQFDITLVDNYIRRFCEKLELEFMQHTAIRVVRKIMEIPSIVRGTPEELACAAIYIASEVYQILKEFPL